MPGKPKSKVAKTRPAPKAGHAMPPTKGPMPAKGVHTAADSPAEVKRLTREIEALKEVLSKRPVSGGDGSASRRDQDKALADRLVRLDERVDALWARVSDLEEALEGETGGTARTREPDFDETPDREFYER
jgi:hypothetical protein